MCVTWQRFRRRQFGVAAGRVNAADLNESCHQHDQSDAHQQHRPPVSLRRKHSINTRFRLKHNHVTAGEDTCHYPLGDVLVQLRVEDGFLQAGQRTVGVHQTALHEDVAVALEVVTGRPGLKSRDLLIEEARESLGAGAAAGAGVHCLTHTHTDMRVMWINVNISPSSAE